METSAAFWWKSDDEALAADVFAYTKWLAQDQNYRQVDNFTHMRLYGQNDLLTRRLYPSAIIDNSNSVSNRVTLNVVQSMIDTVTSKITKNKPKPTFLTDGGDFSQQRRALRLTQFVEGQYEATDFYAKAAIAFQDSCIFGTGALKIFKDGKDIKVERVFIDELMIDDRESIYGAPRQMHQRKWIHKDVLKAMFPDHETAIDVHAQTASQNLVTSNSAYNSEMVLVIESWRLPSKKGAKDGKHAITIENQTLLSEGYKKQYFPFIFWRWGVRPLGFFGQGLAEQLTGLQVEINKILRTIQISMHLVSVPKIFIEAGSKIVTTHLNNQIGGVVKYTGTPPQEGKLGSVPSELFAHLDRLYQRAFEIAGVSQLSAQAKVPEGIESGKAMRTYNDMETERFMSVAQRYEASFMDASRIFIDLGREIAEDYPDYSVKAKHKDNFLKTIKWKDVDLDEDKYIMHIFPTSALATNFSGKLADVQDLINLGVIGKEDSQRLLNFPDLKGFYNYSTAPAEDIMRLIELFVDEGKYETPEPFQDLAYGSAKVQQAMLYYKSQNAPEETLELFRRWLSDADSLVKKATTEAAAQTFQAQANTTAAAEHVSVMRGEPMEAAGEESTVPEVDPNMPPPMLTE